MGKASAIKRAIGWILCLVWLLGMLCPFAAASEAPRKTVRVGYFAFDGYHMQSDDGTRSGYGYELLQRMVGYTNWKLEYVGYDKSWSEMQAMLARGEIDLLTSAQKTPERAEAFAFSDESVGDSTAILTVKAGNDRFMQKDHASWDGMRVGMLQDNSRNERFAEYARDQGFTYTGVYFDNADDLVRSLKAGQQIDAILTSSLRSIQDEWVIAQFDASPFYVMVRRDDDALLADVNRALTQLFNNDPELRQKLMSKYYTPKSEVEIPYTPEERAYVRTHHDTQIDPNLNPDRAPYSYRTDGKPSGILYDIARLIIQRSSLPVTFPELRSREEYGKRIASGDYDIRLDAGFDYARAEELDYRLTSPYLDASISRLYRHDHEGAFQSVALLYKGDISSFFHNKNLGAGMEILYYESTDAIVDAVLSGTCDECYLYTSVANLAVQKEPTNALVAEEMYGYSNSYAVAVNAKRGPTLYSVLQKAVSSISDEAIEEIVRRHSGYEKQPFSLIGYMYDYPLHVAFTCLAILLVAGLIVLVVFLGGRRRRGLERLKQEQQRAEELSRALEAARQADIAKNHFLSSISHEIRTPLNAVIGYNTIARNDLTGAKTDEERRQADMRIMDALTQSEIASKHLLNILNDVLDMSAIEVGKIKLAHEPFDIKSMFGSLTALFFSQTRAKGIELEVLIDKPLEEWFVGDQLRINQVLTNLLANAVKFTPEHGTVKLTVTQESASDTSARIRFVVSDTGIGMTQEYLTRIWLPFEQAEASISRRFGGTGLGLSITKNLVDLMGGSIEVESAPGVGTTFTLELTLERMEQPDKSASYDFSGVNALVVDDDESTCEYIKLLFDRCGAQCRTVTSGEDALSLLQNAKEPSEAFNVCLVDWRMPNMDGLETVRRIRQIAQSSIPIIILSAYDFTEIESQAKEAGVNMFVSKPLFQSSLFDLLANISGRHLAMAMEKNAKFDFSGARVLLAEDNKMNMEVAKRILGSSGLTVDGAWNGREAIGAFLSSPAGWYQAILMDVHMPEMDGYQATRTIRASSHPEAKTIPIIAMTADAFAEDVAEARGSGMNDHVAKPIDIQKLFNTLKKYIPSRL